MVFVYTISYTIYRKELAVATSQTSMSALHTGLMTGYLYLVTRDELVERFTN